MSADFYKVLGLDRSADDEAVKRAYRKLALKYHPERNADVEAKELFYQVAEAYHVLSHAKRRAIYDHYGLDGLKKGVPSREGYEGFEGGYEFHGNAEEMFNQFFGGKNPFSDFFAQQVEPSQSSFGAKFGGLHGMSRAGTINAPTQDAQVEFDLNLTLEELYLGTLKKIKISKKVLNSDGITTSTTEKILTIEVQPGWKQGTRIIFPKEGDQGPNKIPADIVFIVKELKHKIFARSGNDLVLHADIPLMKALTGCVFDVETLDGRLLKIPVNEVISPGYFKTVKGEGMPISKSNGSARGDLILKIKTEFPKNLTDQQKSILKEAFLIPAQ